MSIPRSQRELIEAAFQQETPRPASMPASLPASIGPYRIIRQLGAGGMGTVYEAEQEHPLRRRVALKVIKLGMDTEEIVARFRAERQALAVMDHPNIARVFDAGATDQGRPYFVMEYVPGVRITRYCDQHRLSTAERLALFVQVCHAIQHAHQKGVIHRDIKPSNVVVAEHDGQPVPKVIDFGVAKAIEVHLLDRATLTGEGRLVGTPAYMSPEQLEPQPYGIDTRTDVYALGMLLYEILVGILPYGDTSLKARALADVQRIIREEEPTRPSARVSRLGSDAARAAAYRRTSPAHWRRQLRGDLDWIVMKALEKDRDHRYSSAADLAADIQRHLRHEPVLAGPPSTLYVLRKFVRRNRGFVAGAAAVLVVLLAGIAASTTFAVREAQARRLALWQAYTGSITGAHASVLASQTKTARRYLAQAPAEHRKWEWDYLQAESDQSIEVLTGHEKPVWAVAFDPQRRDGSLLASAGEDWAIRIWDLSAQHESRGSGNREESHDSESSRILSGHTDIVYALAYTPNGRYLASGSQDKTVRIWDLATGRAVAVLEFGYQVFGVAFDPSGNRLAVCGHGGQVRTYELAYGPAVVAAESKNMVGHTRNVFSTAFSPDGQRLATASLDNAARIWDASSGAELSVLRGHKEFVRCVAFSPDGTRLASGSKDGTIRLWDSATGEERGALKGHPGVVQSVAFSPDGQYLASAGDDGSVRLWDSYSREELLALRGHTGFVQSVAWSPDGERLASAGRQDKSVRLWTPFALNHRSALRHEGPVGNLAFGSDGRQLLSLSRTSEPREERVCVWDCRTGEGVAKCTLHGPEGHAAALTYSQSESAIWFDPLCGAIAFLDTNASEPRQVALVGDRPLGQARLAAFDRSGTRLVTAHDDGTIRVWNAINGSQLASWSDAEFKTVHVAISPDGTRVARLVSGGPILVRVLTSDGRPQNADFMLVGFECSGGRSVPVFSPDNTRMAAGCGEDGAVLLWDVTTRKLLHVLNGHEGLVQSVAFSPDGSRLATGSEDNTVRLWDPVTGDELLVLRGHNGFVHAVVFSSDGTMLASAAADGTVRIWDSVPFRERYGAAVGVLGPVKE